MLPTRLELRNFLAYRAPDPVTFTGIHLACLTGPNGVGKSSLLDAITWALWGKARAKRDDDLIHQGASDMQVSLDFEHDGLQYRVQRRRSRAERGSRGALDLMVRGADNRPRLINEDGMRLTQHKINAILRLDYETWIHSAYLQQGRADAFTLATAADRKRILAEILDLEQWTSYEAAAKDQLNRLAGQIDVLQHDISRSEDEFAREPQLRSDLAAVSESLDSTSERLHHASERHLQLANAASALQRERERHKEIERRIEARRDDMAAAQAEVERQGAKIAEYQGAIAQGADIESGYRQLQDARSSQSALAEQLRQIQELDTRQHALERGLADKRAALKREADVIRERISGLDQVQNAAAETDVAELRQRLIDLQALEAQRDDLVAALEAGNLRRAKLTTQLTTLTSEGRALSDRLNRLMAADGATCPLCGQALTARHRNDMSSQLEAERESLRAAYRQCQTDIREIDQARRERERERDALALQLKELPALQRQAGAAEQAERKAEEAAAARQLEAAKLADIEARQSAEDYGVELRRQLTEVQGQRARIGYDPDSHADIKTQLETYAAFDRQYTRLEFARINLPEAQRIRDDTQARLVELERALTQDQAQRQCITDAIAALETETAQERVLRAKVESIRAESQRLQERKTILEQELRAIAAGRQNVKRLSQRLEQTRHQRGLYRDLRAAFGKNGVPALIIETAIPELEAEANDLLDRMTDGRMALRFNMQRERLSGGAIETLDVAVADELGTRAYELYSGGEAFRINFAIRIALSKLLARRAGAQLRTLFIDEGFGTQDEDGQAKLIDAISKVASDFELVLVITHIDDLRDAFPVHLTVEKTPHGSIVTAQ